MKKSSHQPDRPEGERCFEMLVEDLQLKKDDDPRQPYTPYLRAVHSTSRGYAQRVPGSITDRLHDFLSRHEFHAFILFDWQKKRYTNIREQFPLPLALTQAIALREGIPHPMYQGKPACLSVDFMLSISGGGWEAVDFKEKKDYAKQRSKQKLRITEFTLCEVGISHNVITEDDIPKIVVRNLRFLRILYLPFDRPPLTQAEFEKVEELLKRLLISGTTTIYDAAIIVAQTTGISASSLSRSSYWAIANRRWSVDFNRPIGPDYPVCFTEPQLS